MVIQIFILIDLLACVQFTLTAGGLTHNKAWQTLKEYTACFFANCRLHGPFMHVAVIGTPSSMQRPGLSGQLLQAVSLYILKDST